MDSAAAPVPLDRLLAHRAWVRRMARVLVRDENVADDLEQGVWVEALRRPPRGGASVRAWFAAALRHDLVDRVRSETGRARREELHARAEAATSAADVVAEADAHRRVVVAVMDLPEPYRSTVLLRFFQDLPPSEIAARTGVPLETARTRLRRALDLLRGRLGADRGDRDAPWSLLLWPLVRTDGSAVPCAPRAASRGRRVAPFPPPPGEAVDGGAVMKSLASGAAAVVVAVAATLAWWSATSCAAAPEDVPAGGLRAPAPAAPPAAPAAPGERPSETGTLTGIVLEPSGAPLPNALVRATATGRPGHVVRDTRSDGSGRFRIDGLDPGTWRVGVQVLGAGAFSVELDERRIAAGEQDATVRLPAGEVGGRVVLAADGTPVAAPDVQLSIYALDPDVGGTRRLGRAVGVAFAERDGAFRFRGLVPGPYRMFAHPRRAALRVVERDVELGAFSVEDLRIALDAMPTGTVRVVVRDASGAAVEGATLTLVRTEGSSSTSTTAHPRVEAPGTYVVELEAGRRRIGVGGPALRPADVDVDVREGATTQVEVVLAARPDGVPRSAGGRDVAGVARARATGAPLSHREVQLALYTVDPWRFVSVALAASDGTFRFRGVPAGAYRLVATPMRAGLRPVQRDVVVTAAGDVEGLALEFDECPWGTVRLVVRDAEGRPLDGVSFATVVVTDPATSTSTTLHAVRTAPGVYAAELEAGARTVAAFLEGRHGAQAEVRVVEGRTVEATFVLHPKAR